MVKKVDCRKNKVSLQLNILQNLILEIIVNNWRYNNRPITNQKPLHKFSKLEEWRRKSTLTATGIYHLIFQVYISMSGTLQTGIWSFWSR